MKLSIPFEIEHRLFHATQNANEIMNRYAEFQAGVIFPHIHAVLVKITVHPEKEFGYWIVSYLLLPMDQYQDKGTDRLKRLQLTTKEQVPDEWMKILKQEHVLNETNNNNNQRGMNNE